MKKKPFWGLVSEQMSEDKVLVCCICKKIKKGNMWVKADIPVGATVKYTNCERCFENED